jgi:hypothetical protein
MGRKEGKVDNQPKAEKKGPIPERTHWILRKMIHRRFEELVGATATGKTGRTPVRPPRGDTY